jgi:hypothetical protein
MYKGVIIFLALMGTDPAPKEVGRMNGPYFETKQACLDSAAGVIAQVGPKVEELIKKDGGELKEFKVECEPPKETI